jgi:hypothetical protein
MTEKNNSLKLTLDSKMKRHNSVVWRLINGEAVIVTPSDNIMHSLNEVGTRIWELTDGKRKLGDVALCLQTEFNVDTKQAQTDTLWFVGCLKKKGLVESI